ncbi:MAG TPA: serine--tRNA ligase [Patescibacteria group bacterium]
MLDINYIRQNPEKVKRDTASKNKNPELVEKVLDLDKKRRNLIAQIEELRAKRNEIAKKGKASNEGKKIKEELKEIEPKLEEVERDYKNILYQIPNIIAEGVIVGKDESENKVLRKWGKIPKFNFDVKDHLEIGQALGIIDTETAAKVSGARYAYLKGEGALLEFALVMFAFETLMNKRVLEEIAKRVEKGYTAKPFVPVVPPQMIKPDVYVKMARLGPDTIEERYHLPKDDIYLVGSAEHTLGPMHMDEAIPEDNLPLRYVGFSTSFRREAGSYGKDTKGILRVHQFDKVEMESFTTPDNSIKEQDFFVGVQEYLMQALGIPYQVVSICTGDMGGPDYRQIDIESWMPGQGKYRETHTSDLMTDYQSRRLNTKVKRKDGSTELVHMNDATAFAIGRTIIAIVENYQQKDGSVKIPKVLQKWMGMDKITLSKV